MLPRRERSRQFIAPAVGWLALTALLFQLRGLSPLSGDSAEISAFVERPVWVWYLRWPLTHLAAQALHRALGWGGADCLALLSSAAGALFALTVGALAHRSPLALILLVSSVSAALAGHIEVYGWPLLVLLWLLLLGPQHLRGEIAFPPLVILFGLGCLAHMLLAFYTPALIWLGWAGRRRALGRGADPRRVERELKRGLAWATLFLAIIGTVPLLMPIGGLDNDLERLVPLTMPEVPRSSNQVTLLAPAHLGQIAIFLALSCPLGLPLVLLRIGRIGADDETRSLSVAALCGLGFLLLWHPDNGWRGDWDLFSHPGLVINVLAWRLWEKRPADRAD